MRAAKSSISAPSTIRKPFEKNWPVDRAKVYAWRQKQLSKFEVKPDLIDGAKEYYKKNIDQFINHWCDTYDPRNVSKGLPAKLPLVMFHRQEELVDFVLSCMRGDGDGLIEKARDMGATWVCVGISVALWLFYPGTAIGWGSRKQELVDRLGDPSSIFEKIRQMLRQLPPVFLPDGFNPKDHTHYMRIVNPENDSTIIGEIGDQIGRGGRTTLYFKDESAWYARPEGIDAALGDNTRCQIDLSSVSTLGTVFHRKREAGEEWQPGKPIHRDRANVFIMDRSDHPEKGDDWYAQREAKARSSGLLHMFRREVDRDYAASVEGVIIPSEHAKAAIDAHIKLGIEPSGAHVGGLDVADEGLDKNAQTIRQGILCKFVDQWEKGDIGETTNKSIEICKRYLVKGQDFENQYDCIGVGAGVKAEYNRLVKVRKIEGHSDQKKLPKNLKFIAWNAAAGVQNPYHPVVQDNDPDDPETKPALNRDFYHNLKAQAWWEVAKRFAITYRAVNEPHFTYDPDDIISISSDIPLLWTLIKELSQPIMTKSVNAMKLIIQKKPEGAKSPNIADSFVMAYFPVIGAVEAALAIGGYIVVEG